MELLVIHVVHYVLEVGRHIVEIDHPLVALHLLHVLQVLLHVKVLEAQVVLHLLKVGG